MGAGRLFGGSLENHTCNARRVLRNTVKGSEVEVEDDERSDSIE